MGAPAYREQLYDIFSRAEMDVTGQIQSALELGTEYLDLSIGFFTRIRDGRQEIRQATGGNPLIQEGENCPLEEAYCRRTVEIDSALSVQDVADSPAISQAAAERFGLGAYIGAKDTGTGCCIEIRLPRARE